MPHQSKFRAFRATWATRFARLCFPVFVLLMSRNFGLKGFLLSTIEWESSSWNKTKGDVEWQILIIVRAILNGTIYLQFYSISFLSNLKFLLLNLRLFCCLKTQWSNLIRLTLRLNIFKYCRKYNLEAFLTILWLSGIWVKFV